MPEYNGNDVYLRINSRDVEAIWRGFEMKLAIGKEDVSAGAGIDWTKNASKLNEITAKLTLIWDTATAVTGVAEVYNLAQDHIVPIVYGPENNTAGKGKHDQDFLVTGINGPTTNHNKTLVMLEVDLVSSGEPRSNIYDGDTF